MKRNTATLIILFLLFVLVCTALYSGKRIDGYGNNIHTGEGDVSIQKFVGGITPAIRLRKLPSICKLGLGVSYTSEKPTGQSLPEEFDLRKYNLLTPVMNQEMCGGCWAFATVGALADRINFWLWNQAGRPTSGWTSKWKDLVLTPQYLLSCDADASANGCEGSSSLVEAIKAVTKGQKDMMYGLPNGTFMYQVHPFDVCQHEQGSGVVGQQQQGKGLKCTGSAQDDCDLQHMQFHFDSGTPVFSYKNWYPVSTGDFDSDIQKLKEEIYKNGPVVMGISVYENMYDSSGGIKNGDIQTASGQFLGGHAISAIGWGKNYLIIKNSWGPKWGIGGYWYQSSSDRDTLSFGGGTGLNTAAGLPDIPSSLLEDKIQIPIIPPGNS